VRSSWEPPAEDGGPLDDILQLADVARPVVGDEVPHQRLRDRLDPVPQPGTVLPGEATHQRGDLARKIGRFELADRGTIFLGEVGELPLDLQVKLLRVLQEGEFERVGGPTIRVDVRVIAATNRALERAVQEGRFRADLFYRLNVFPIRLPPLRERREAVGLLVRYFVAKYAPKLGKTIVTIPQRELERLEAYPWPGNVRELENVIERAVIVSRGPGLALGEWLPAPGARPAEARVPTLEELEGDHIRAVLDMTGWRVSGEQGAAKVLGLKPTTLEARMKKLGVNRHA
jgi:formate hydrogenlyase transcriptional activator